MPAGTLRIALTVLFPIAALVTGIWVYRDAKRHGWDDLAPYIGFGIGTVLLAGSVPGLVALAVASDPASQGFPTALRIVPGLATLAIYLSFR